MQEKNLLTSLYYVPLNRINYKVMERKIKRFCNIVFGSLPLSETDTKTTDFVISFTHLLAMDAVY